MSEPERIWLQTEGSSLERYEGVTWCAEAIDDDDTEYIRADVVDEQLVRAFGEGAHFAMPDGDRMFLPVGYHIKEARRLLAAGTLGRKEERVMGSDEPFASASGPRIAEAMRRVRELKQQIAADRETLDWLDEHATEFSWTTGLLELDEPDPEELNFNDVDPQPFRAAVDRARVKRAEMMDAEDEENEASWHREQREWRERIDGHD